MAGLGRQDSDASGTAGPGDGAVRRVVRMLPVLLILLGLVFDVMTPPSFTGSPSSPPPR